MLLPFSPTRRPLSTAGSSLPCSDRSATTSATNPRRMQRRVGRHRLFTVSTTFLPKAWRKAIGDRCHKSWKPISPFQPNGDSVSPTPCRATFRLASNTSVSKSLRRNTITQPDSKSKECSTTTLFSAPPYGQLLHLDTSLVFADDGGGTAGPDAGEEVPPNRRSPTAEPRPARRRATD